MDRLRHKILSIAIVVIMAASAIWVAFAYTQESNEVRPADIVTTAYKADKYGNVVLDIDAETFLNLGYRTGDFVNIKWDGGEVRGFTTQNWQGVFTFETFINLNSDGTLSVGCYCAKCPIDVGKDLTLKYMGASNRDKIMPNYFSSEWKPSEGETEEDQMNYRYVTYGDIAEGRLYRSSNALPKDTDQYADIMNNIVKRHDADYLLDMIATKSDLIEQRDAGLLDEDNIAWYLDDDRVFAESLSVLVLQDPNYAHIFKYIADNDGSYLMFCSLGKDRTGFVMMVLEALMGATLSELIEDYSYSYVCLYDTPIDSPEYKMYYELIKPLIVAMHDPSVMDHLGTVNFDSYDLTTFDLMNDAKNYLINYLGLTQEDVDNIRLHLSS